MCSSDLGESGVQRFAELEAEVAALRAQVEALLSERAMAAKPTRKTTQS